MDRKQHKHDSSHRKQLQKSHRATDLSSLGASQSSTAGLALTPAKPKARPVTGKDFEKLRLIGRGGVGKVYLVRRRNTQELYAMKVLSKQEMIEKNKIRRVLTEREILATSQHPFIVTLHWCWTSSKRIYFVMDWCAGGPFFRVLEQTKHLPEKVVRGKPKGRFYAAEVLVALEYLHILGYVYRDLKPENLLLDGSGHIKLTDFDLSKASENPTAPQVVRELFGGDIKKINGEPDFILHSLVGTAEYIAPEVISGTGYGAACDWWTFGILIYEMLFGCAPFQGTDREEIFKNLARGTLRDDHLKRIENEKVKFPEHIEVSKEAKRLVKALLTPDVRKRLGAEHGAADIKAHPFFAGINWALLRDLKPPIIPRVNVDFSRAHVKHPSEEEKTSFDHAAHTISDSDPFKDFLTVSKPDDAQSDDDKLKEQKNLENE